MTPPKRLTVAQRRKLNRLTTALAQAEWSLGYSRGAGAGDDDREPWEVRARLDAECKQSRAWTALHKYLDTIAPADRRGAVPF